MVFGNKSKIKIKGAIIEILISCYPEKVSSKEILVLKDMAGYKFITHLNCNRIARYLLELSNEGLIEKIPCNKSNHTPTFWRWIPKEGELV